MSSLNFKHLRYFWCVAHEGHLTRAAERLHVSQSALSTQIRTLEQRLGHELFDRQGRTLVLTEAGKIALDYADAIFSAGDELLGTLGQLEQRSRPNLRIGALATLSRNFQLAFLSALIGRDDIRITLRAGSLGELMTALEAHNLDIVLVNQLPLRGEKSAWTAHEVDQQPVSLVGVPELLPQGTAKADLAGLLSSRPLILPSRDSGVRSGFDALAMKLGVRPDVVADVDDMAMMRLLARAGAGLAVLPAIAVLDELQTGRLVTAARLPGLTETFSAITLERRFPNPLVTRVLEFQRPRTRQKTSKKENKNSR